MPSDQYGHFLQAESVDHAIKVLSDDKNRLVPLAGGTWLSRQEIREGSMPDGYLVLNRLAELKGITLGETVSIGALATHEEIAISLAKEEALAALFSAASKSATPGVRRIATIGGSLATSDFPSGDFAPALLALGAELEIAGPQGRRIVPLETFLSGEGSLDRSELLLRVQIMRYDGYSAHARLTMKTVGDYPVAIVSMSCSIGPAGEIADARVAVGAVQHRAFRWTALEAQLNGQVLHGAAPATSARACLEGMAARDDVDASGDYRIKVLPELVERAFAEIAERHAEGRK